MLLSQQPGYSTIAALRGIPDVKAVACGRGCTDLPVVVVGQRGIFSGKRGRQICLCNSKVRMHRHHTPSTDVGITMS